MGRRQSAVRAEQTVEVMGHSFTLKTAEPRRLEAAARWLNERLTQLASQHPLIKSQEIYLLLLLELAFERLDFFENGKALLKDTEELLEWLESSLK